MDCVKQSLCVRGWTVFRRRLAAPVWCCVKRGKDKGGRCVAPLRVACDGRRQVGRCPCRTRRLRRRRRRRRRRARSFSTPKAGKASFMTAVCRGTHVDVR